MGGTWAGGNKYGLVPSRSRCTEVLTRMTGWKGTFRVWCHGCIQSTRVLTACLLVSEKHGTNILQLLFNSPGMDRRAALILINVRRPPLLDNNSFKTAPPPMVGPRPWYRPGLWLDGLVSCPRLRTRKSPTDL